MNVLKVHDLPQKKSSTKKTAFNNTNGVVVTVNPKLDELISTENINAKAKAAKEMFANYRKQQ